jgi:integrase
LAEWPAADRRLWNDSLEVGNIIDGTGIRAKYRAISNRKIERGYGRFLTFADRAGFLDFQPPTSRITPKRVEAYVTEMREYGNSGYTILARLQELYEAAVVMDANRDWSWIRRIASRVRATTKPSRDKRAKMVSTADLLDLGIKLMKRAESEPTPRLGAITFRDGLIIALAALRPLRLSNLASIELHRHLVNHGEFWRLQFEPHEVKNGDSLDIPWPDELVVKLEAWLSRWRPILCRLRSRWAREIGNALWVSCHGSPLTEQATYDRLVDRTKAEFGFWVNPHLFRDIAATTMAEADPENIGMAAEILVHADFRTTELYYLHARQIKGTRRYQEELLRLRRRRKG